MKTNQLVIKLNTKHPENHKIDIIEALKHSLELCEKNPTLATIQSKVILTDLLKECNKNFTIKN